MESIISYSPSVVNYVTGTHDTLDIIYNNDNLNFSYYFSDCAQFDHMLNLYPVFQIGTTINYRWLHGPKTFVFSNTYRVLGFNFDVYNLSFRFSIADVGFSWFKYGWNRTITGRNNQWCLLVSPITTSLAYRIKIAKNVDIMINLGYSLQVIFDNKLTFPNVNYKASMFLEHVFNQGIGFKFYTRNFNE